MAGQLSAAQLASAIDAELAALRGPLPDDPSRQALFTAIARAVVQHLHANRDAFAVDVPATLPATVAPDLPLAE